MKFDHVLLIGFGGPTRPEEVKPFLRQVTRGLPIPEARLKAVLHHYEAIGGRSPYNEQTLKFFRQLEEKLKASDVSIPLFSGMRNWHPFLKDAMAEIKKRGLKKGLGVILAPHRSDASFEKYIRNVEEAQQTVSANEIEYEYLKPWHAHPLFIEAQADEIRQVLEGMNSSGQKEANLLFSAHSIPLEIARKCRYAEEVAESSALVAKRLNHSKWMVAYQSRSGSPSEPWLEPDILSCVRELRKRGEKVAVVIPIGFICENAEILYDLDIEAREEAQRLGIQYRRASTVANHEKFMEMFTELIQEQME